MKNTMGRRFKKLVASVLAVVTLTSCMSLATFAAEPVQAHNTDKPSVTVEKVEAIRKNTRQNRTQQTQRYTIGGMNKRVTVTSSSVSIRTAPWTGENSKVIGTARRGQILQVTGQVFQNGRMIDCYRINWGGRTAFVTKSCTKVPVAQGISAM